MNAASTKPNVIGIVLWSLLGLGVIGGLAAWWLATHKRVEQVVDLPRTGEARRNPMYALKVALEKDGIAVAARRRLQLFRIGEEPPVPLAARDTLVLYNDPRTLTAAEVDALLAWVEGGGHLIVRTPPHGLLAKNSPVPLLARLQLQPLGEDHSACESVRGIPADGASAAGNAASTDTSAGAEEGEAYPVRGVMFCGGRRFNLSGANPVHSWGDLRRGYVFVRIQRGQGSVDVLADLGFLSSDELEQPVHHEFTRQLLQPNHRAGTMHLVYAAQMPSLWTTMILQSWMAWTPLLLALLLWLWRRMERFGPQLAAPASERRSLLEHVVASGEHTYRYGHAHLLHTAVRNAFLARLRRRDPQAAALQGEPQLALLCERFRDVPAADIRDALIPSAALHAPPDRRAFRSRIATLIRLRNRL